jgi:hypothetical protein
MEPEFTVTIDLLDDSFNRVRTYEKKVCDVALASLAYEIECHVNEDLNPILNPANFRSSNEYEIQITETSQKEGEMDFEKDVEEVEEEVIYLRRVIYPNVDYLIKRIEKFLYFNER